MQSMFGIESNNCKAHEDKLTAQKWDKEQLQSLAHRFSRCIWFSVIPTTPEVAILECWYNRSRTSIKLENIEIVIGHGAKVIIKLCDHQKIVVDGATAQKAMNEIKRLLNDPELINGEA